MIAIHHFFMLPVAKARYLKIARVLHAALMVDVVPPEKKQNFVRFWVSLYKYQILIICVDGI